MEIEKGFSFLIKGHEDVNEFAKGVLALVNLKSNKMGVYDFRTYPESNEITVITEEDVNEKYLESYVGKIVSKTSIEILVIDSEDVKNEVQKEVDKRIDNEVDYHLELDLY